MKDHYTTLGVARTATEDEIKRAFRRLASQYHPDKGGDTRKFQEIQEAYAVLGDPQKRAEYDNPRSHARMNFNPHANFNFDEIFNMFGANLRERQSGMVRMQLWIGLADVARGGPRAVSVQVNNTIQNIEIDIPLGVADGDTIRYAKLAPGGHDLVVTYRVHPDPRWQRDKSDLTTEISVDVWSLILGGEVQISDILGRHFMLTIPANTQPGTMLRMRGRGLPPRNLPGDRPNAPPGDLLLKVQARLPDKISQDLLDAINKEIGQ